MKAKKIIIAVLCVALAICVGVGIYFMVKPSTKQGNDANPTEIGLFVDGVKIENPDIMTINGEQVDFELFRYYFLTLYNNAIASDPEFFATEENKTELINATNNYVKMFYLSSQICAENGFKLTDEETKAITDNLDLIKQSFTSTEEYEDTLAAANLTEELFIKLETNIALQSYLINDIIGEDVANEVLRSKHILIKFEEPTEDSSATEGSRSKEDAKKLAGEILAKAKDGEDFDTLIKEYGEDPGMTANPDGYYFLEGQMVDSFYEGTKALEFNAISDLVESDFGYHIILRLEPDKAALTPALVSELAGTNQALSEKFNAFITKSLDEAVVVNGADYDKLTKENIK